MAASNSTAKCLQCGAQPPARANFCPRCGHPQGKPPILSATIVTPILQQWRKLSLTMTRKEVRKLLGEPLRIEHSKNAGPNGEERWHYDYQSATTPDQRTRGEIAISTLEGRVLHWSEPDFSILTGT